MFVTVEASGRTAGELVWIDAESFKIVRRRLICREPHALAVTPDGAWLYVPCRDGRYWVVDGRTGAVAAKIETGGRPHNALISRDGRFALLSPMGRSREVVVVEIPAGHRVVGRIRFAGSVRPSALSADGRYLFQHVDGLNGFQVADVGRRSMVATVEHATPLKGVRLPFLAHIGRLGLGGLARCHGLGVRPDRDEVWSVCADRITIHALATPEFQELDVVRLPAKGYWITFAPDGRYAFVALSGACGVAVVDTHTRRVVKLLKAGRGPKRNLVLRTPA